MNWIELIIGLLSGGGLVSAFTMPQIIKKAKAEAQSAQIDNVNKSAASWEKLANELQEQLKEMREAYNALREEHKAEMDKMNEKIDMLYTVINDWRDKYNHSQEELSKERVWRAANEIKLCEVKACDTRTPPTGY